MNVKILIPLAVAFTLISCSEESSSSTTTDVDNNTNVSVGDNNTNASTDSFVGKNDNSKKYVCSGGGKMVHGYQLPPCPDSIENDKTLLSIDTNDNGVRDDVEVWIYHHYDTHPNCVREDINITLANGTVREAITEVCDDTVKVPYHQIVREIAMQRARAYQIVIQEPEKAKETTQYVDNSQYCEWYFIDDAKRYGNPTFIDEDNYNLYDAMRSIQFNTIRRAKAYSEYNFI
ncbi:MAG: hypothetical protein LBG21_06165 [Campylobacteraceae bacterium]|nr:hypothetical protein [Campylobacteraceae bacterium]